MTPLQEFALNILTGGARVFDDVTDHEVFHYSEAGAVRCKTQLIVSKEVNFKRRKGVGLDSCSVMV